MAAYFSIILVVVTLVSGVIWLADKFYLAPQRQLKLANAQAQCEGELDADTIQTITEPSTLVDAGVQIFPVIAFVLVLRSFLYEPFQIPSGSMMPTLLDGDFILVNKYNYGLRDPVARKKFIEIGEPERGDIVVFKYPIDQRIDYIKRVIGVPGDTVVYQNKSVYIKPKCQDSDTQCPDFEKVLTEWQGEFVDGPAKVAHYKSSMLGREHDILIDHAKSDNVQAFCYLADSNLCYQSGTQRNEFVVPEGQYFVMGDNRDNSTDSRFWGFVKEENLVGEAVFIWMSFDFERSADDWLPTWVPTGIRFERLGGLT